jgi:hypothetical protein
MALRLFSFNQPVCMVWMQRNLPAGKWKRTRPKTGETEAVENPLYRKDCQLKATPTFVPVQDGTVRERIEGVVHMEKR